MAAWKWVLGGLGLYAIGGALTVARERRKRAEDISHLAPGVTVIPSQHPVADAVVQAATWPLVLIDPFKK